MPLTPADVHNVAFSKPPIGKRGYNEDEVDAFLELVENELTRLIEENADLRQRVTELDQELSARGHDAAQLGQVSLLLYLGVTLGVQGVLVRRRARDLAPA